MSVEQLTAVWVVTNVVAIAVTFSSLLDARQNQNAVRLLDAADPAVSRSRGITTSADVRREVLRITMAALMLAAALPQLTLPALMLVPVSLCITCLFDARDRRRLTVVTAAEIVVERDSAIKELMRLIKENTRISQGASDNAEKSYHEANDINNRMLAQDKQINEQGKQILAQGERAAGTANTIESTAAQVHDLHAGTAPQGRET